jgi:hypothetical protein
MEWQPIETAPLDRPLFVTDGLVFGVATRWTSTDQQTHYWSPVAGWCVWDEDTEWETGEYEQRGADGCRRATHWTEIPSPPKEP